MSDYPKEIILEVTNRCNLRCVMCHFHGIGARRVRPSGDMAPALWRKILRELAQSPETHSLITHGAGEPLLYPGLFELLEEAKSLGNVTVGFMTNAMLLTPEVSRRLLMLGVDWLAFSVDGVEPEPHARYRRNSDLETIERHIDYLIQIKNAQGTPKPALCFNMVRLPEIAHQEASYVARWLPAAAHVMISNYRPMGSRRLTAHSVPGARQPCANIFRQMVVGWNGTVALCCEDIHAEVEVGDLTRQSLSEVWNGPRLNRIREIHNQDLYDEMPFCRDCDTWAASHVLSSAEDPGKGFEKIVTPSYAMYKQKDDNAQK
jgi:radical SAM protein with 4Fe4S-binding SPASM domain